MLALQYFQIFALYNLAAHQLNTSEQDARTTKLKIWDAPKTTLFESGFFR